MQNKSTFSELQNLANVFLEKIVAQLTIELRSNYETELKWPNATNSPMTVNIILISWSFGDQSEESIMRLPRNSKCALRL